MPLALLDILANLPAPKHGKDPRTNVTLVCPEIAAFELPLNVSALSATGKKALISTN
jgi:hypothetical protein